MLRMELVGAAIAMTITWVIIVIFAITYGGRAPTGIILTLATAVAAAAWVTVWASYTRSSFRALHEQIVELRQQVQDAEEERDVDLAMARLKPHLRVIGNDHHN
jgi:glutathione S-transferase